MPESVVNKFDALTKDQVETVLKKVRDKGQLPLEVLQSQAKKNDKLIQEKALKGDESAVSMLHRTKKVEEDDAVGWGSKTEPILDENGKVIAVKRETSADDTKYAAQYLSFLENLFDEQDNIGGKSQFQNID